MWAGMSFYSNSSYIFSVLRDYVVQEAFLIIYLGNSTEQGHLMKTYG
jgi:hypothetical protein